MNEELKYTNPEPEEYDKHLIKEGLELETHEHIRWRMNKQHYDNFNSIPKEQRQKILDQFNKEGKSIREIAKQEKIESTIITDIIYLNIKEIHIMNEKTL